MSLQRGIATLVGAGLLAMTATIAATALAAGTATATRPATTTAASTATHVRAGQGAPVTSQAATAGQSTTALRPVQGRAPRPGSDANQGGGGGHGIVACTGVYVDVEGYGDSSGTCAYAPSSKADFLAADAGVYYEGGLKACADAGVFLVKNGQVKKDIYKQTC